MTVLPNETIKSAPEKLVRVLVYSTPAKVDYLLCDI